MSDDVPRWRDWKQTLILAAFLFVLVIGLSSIPVVRQSELRLADSFFRLAPRSPQRSRVLLVTIDDESLRQYGRWPWSRTRLAELTRNLSQAGAQVIGLDILLAESQTAEADGALRDALANGRAVIVGKIGSYVDGAHWIEPLPGFAQVASVGHAQAVLDVDGVCRRFPVRELTIDGPRWAFAVELARHIDLQHTAQFLASYNIPFDNESAALSTAKPVLVPIAYRRDRFDSISAARVLQGGDLGIVRGRPVLVGFGPAEISDRLSTPLTGELPSPGVEVHAQILESILTGRSIRPVPLWGAALLLLSTSVLVVLAFRRWHGWAAAALLVAAAVAVYGAAFAAFLATGRILPIGALMLAVIVGPLLAYTADFVLVERSVLRQLRQLRRWLATQGEQSGTDATNLTWRLEVLHRLQAELGSLYELHNTLMEATQDLVAIFDTDEHVLLSNRAFEHAYGPNAAAATLSRLRARLVPKDDAPFTETDRVVEGEAYLDGELYSVRIVPLPPTTLAPTGGMIALLSSLRTREERDRARAEALGFITHELRTPLASIQGFAELMIHYPDSRVCASAPQTIFRESKRLLALISSYLDVLRVDAGARPLHSEPLKLADVIFPVIEILQPLAATARMQIVCEPCDSVAFVGDAALLSGAVLNLVSNAIKYGQAESEIRVRGVRADDEVIVEVHNLGQPIAVQDIPRLFDPYFRAPGSAAGQTGWGIGLAFVKRIAEKHGGSVSVDSQLSGTRFAIHLPVDAGVTARGIA